MKNPFSHSEEQTAAGAAGGWLAGLRKAANGALDLLFPRDCVLSGVPADAPPWRYISKAGLASLHRIEGARCETCGHPFFGVLDGPQRCPHCMELAPCFQQGRVAVLARGPARRLVHILKYHRGVWLAEDIARIIATTPEFPEYLEGAVLVPVPLHPARQRKRGYNQAQLLAKNLVHLLPDRRLRVETRLLERVRNTTTQTRLNREERAANLSGAFQMREGAVLEPQARYVVIDDVFTTGSTLNACCEVLRMAGATRIDIAAFAHG